MSYNGDAFVQLCLVDDQRGGKSDGVSMRWLGQQPPVAKLQTEIPSCRAPLAIVDHDGVEQAFAPNQAHTIGFRYQLLHFLPENVP